MLAWASKADITISNITATVQQSVITTNTVSIKKAKAVWTGFSIQYFPPEYKKFMVSVSYFLKNLDTGNEIPGTRKTERLTQEEVVKFSMETQLDFNAVGGGIGMMIDKYMETKLIPKR